MGRHAAADIHTPSCRYKGCIDTIARKWQASLPGDYSFLPAEDYLLEKYPCAVANDDEDALFIAGHILPDAALTEAVGRLQPGQQLCASDSTVIARRGAPDGETLIWDNEYKAIRRPYNISCSPATE